MSSNDIAVSVRGLSKSYTIAHNDEKHTTMGEAMLHRFKNPLQRAETETFWALKDLDFDVKKGDVVGIIGRNGAGKSTLLKILSQITEPTSGEIKLYGRVGSLLEVGTGFHPELTGRENIFLNGAILGMRKSEIQRQFDAIVDFSSVEQFLDTPVKRYSSGMYVRLAFAVAAHLSSEILVIDEVLAVGDAEFQRKCLGKMKDVASGGRTVLFVSHNLASVTNLCKSCLYLSSGELRSFGEVNETVKIYTSATHTTDTDSIKDISRSRPSWAKPYITSARALNGEDQEQIYFPLGSEINIEVSFVSPQNMPLRKPVLGIVINHSTFGTAGAVNTRMAGFEVEEGQYQSGTLSAKIESFPFLQGYYSLDLWLGDGPTDVDALMGYVEFEIEDADIYGSGKVPFATMGVGIVYSQWNFTDGSSTTTM